MRKIKYLLAMTLASLAVGSAPSQASTHRAMVTQASAESTFKSFMRQFCGNGVGVCVTMNPAYCTNVGGYQYYCTTSWLETSSGGFRNQYGWGHVYQTWVADYAYRTT